MWPAAVSLGGSPIIVTDRQIYTGESVSQPMPARCVVCPSPTPFFAGRHRAWIPQSKLMPPFTLGVESGARKARMRIASPLLCVWSAAALYREESLYAPKRYGCYRVKIYCLIFGVLQFAQDEITLSPHRFQELARRRIAIAQRVMILTKTTNGGARPVPLNGSVMDFLRELTRQRNGLVRRTSMHMYLLIPTQAHCGETWGGPLDVPCTEQVSKTFASTIYVTQLQAGW